MYENTAISIDQATDLERKQLQISFRKRIKNHWNNPLVKKKVWDGYFNFLYKNKFIPIGLWRELLNVCEKYNFKINKSFLNDIIDSSIKKEDIQNYFDEFFKDSELTPRYYQIEAVYKFIKYRRMVAEMATSSGKTLIIFMIYIYLNHLFQKEGKSFKMLIIVPTVGLVLQSFEGFKEYNEGKKNKIKISMVSSETLDHKKAQISKYNIAIGTFQSFIKKPDEYLEAFDAVLVDESHTANAKTVKTVLTKCTNAKYRMGLSGTTDIGNHAEGFGIQEHLGPMIYRISPKELIDQNFATPVNIKVFHLDYLDPDKKKKVMELHGRKNFDKSKLLSIEKDLVVASKKRLKFIIKLLEKTTKNTLVLFSSIEKGYGKKILKILKEHNNNKECFYVDGKTPADTRDNYKKKMEKGNNRILIASFGTFSTGISIKNLHNVFLIESYKSEKLIKQSIGRGMRKLEDKDKVNIIDIVDDFRYKEKGKKLSRGNYLWKHGQERKKIYKNEQFPIKTYRIKL